MKSDNELKPDDMRFAPHSREPRREARARQMVDPNEVPPPEHPLQRRDEHQLDSSKHRAQQRLQ